MWALFPLLLAAALTIPLLNLDAFSGDEPASLLAAGIRRPGPWSPADVWTSVNARQALGWPTLLSIWGHFGGWSEVAVRSLSIFAGQLTLAWVYRTGRDLLAPWAGLFATLLLSASVFFLAYMVHARVFTLVSLFTALSIWSYWRIALHPQPPGRSAQAGLMLGSIGMLYAHYYCAMFLPVLGLYHVLFVPKKRRWWRPVLLLVLAALLATAQLPNFLKGFGRTNPHDLALTSTEALAHLVRHLTNGLVFPSQPLDGLMLASTMLVLVVGTLIYLRARNRAGVTWLLVFVSATLLMLMLAVNEVVMVLTPRSIRYMMPLLSLSALLAGAGLARLAGNQRHLVVILLALWLLAGVWLTRATDFRYELGFFLRTDFHRIFPLASQYVPATDLLIMDFEVAGRDARLVQARDLNGPWDTLYRYREDPYESIRPVHSAYPYIWLLYRTKDRVSMTDLPGELGRVFCERTLEVWGYTLERYALHSVENCPDRPVRLVFDSDIQLTAPEITISDGLLRLDAHFRSADDYLLSRYSLAVHVIDPRTGERIAQGDTGVGPGAIVPLRSEIDISALPPGDYELRVALYDWQTGARLSARDLDTDEVGDIHTLHRFRHN